MMPAKLSLTIALILASAAAAAQSPVKGDAVRGTKIFTTFGCYQCHGYQGQGSNAGSTLAPNPVAYAAFAYQLRQPRARMPAYSLKILSDQDAADLYAYLLTIPKARAVADIPLLAKAQKPEK
ncbi:MAG TPA: cytochrome c [Steroidobacteraceae bacterium]|nr:cytochrome c [Steroidobacteraceae bacterium]